jgi:RimJ/RimL family protein N-acetyltransferase
MKLQTKRLILRNPTVKDVENLVEGLNNIKISRYLPKMPYPYKKKDALEWVKKCNEKSKSRKKESYNFQIELKEEKKIVGGIDLHKFDFLSKVAEIEYWVNEKYWKKGVISEAAIEVINVAFKKLGVNRLGLRAYTENTASNAVAKKLGFTFEGTMRQVARSNATGKIHDTNIYSMLRNEWPKNKKRLETEMKKYD